MSVVVENDDIYKEKVFSEHLNYLNPDSPRPWEEEVEAVVNERMKKVLIEVMQSVGAKVDKLIKLPSGNYYIYSKGVKHHAEK